MAAALVGVAIGFACGESHGRSVGFIDGVKTQQPRIASVQSELKQRDQRIGAQRACVADVKRRISERANALNTPASMSDAVSVIGQVFGQTMRCSKTAGLAYIGKDDIDRLISSF
jgi:hypothetical protein